MLNSNKKIVLKQDGRYLVLPIEYDAPQSCITVWQNNKQIYKLKGNFAQKQINFWNAWKISDPYVSDAVTISCESHAVLIQAAKRTNFWPEALDAWVEKERPQYHFTTYAGNFGEIKSIVNFAGKWYINYTGNPFSISDKDNNTIYCASSEDFLHWNHEEKIFSVFNTHSLQKSAHKKIQGDIDDLFFCQTNNQNIYIAKQKIGEQRPSVYNTILSLPFFEKNDIVAPAFSTERLRIWKREWRNEKICPEFCAKLRFRIAPAKWPDIVLLPADGTDEDIGGDLFELELKIHPGQEKTINGSFCGITFSWDAQSYLLTCGTYTIKAPLKNETFNIKLWIDRSCAELYTGDAVLILKRNVSVQNIPKKSSFGALVHDQSPTFDNDIYIYSSDGTAFIEQLTVYGLRSTYFQPDHFREIQRKCTDSNEKIIFKGETFTIYNTKVVDTNYGNPPAYVPDCNTVLSPPRLTEEFQWRNTPWHDMVRHINRSEIWHPAYEICRFPEIKTGIPSYDAAYKILLDIFYQCSSGGFNLKNEEEMWSAGQFQGKGQGFGVWLRDTTCIGLRTGNLIDPERARRTLLYTVKKGFDNGPDGPAMPIVGIWDYYLATGDATILFESWPYLLKKISVADQRYNEEYNLIYADRATANDAFPEEECGGFSFSTNLYFMYAYRAMEKIGVIVSANSEDVLHWQLRANEMEKALKEKYWNEKYGYFTSGPIGSEAYQKGCWETSGIEASIWDKFGLANKEQISTILNQLTKVAMTDYGIKLFPHRKEKNLYCQAIWVAWTAGYVSAAAQIGRVDLVMILLSQQVRNSLLHKTIHEVIDTDTGRSDRWPGQLWHAAGALSCYFYGLFGIHYNENGMTFTPAIPKELENITMKGLRYRNGVFHIKTQGIGILEEMLVDGISCNIVPPDIKGSHEIILRLKQNK